MLANAIYFVSGMIFGAGWLGANILVKSEWRSDNMAKELPPNIEQLKQRAEFLNKHERYHKQQAEIMSNEWLQTRIQLQRECNHRYTDGTSAWRGGYAYSICEICGESDW